MKLLKYKVMNFRSVKNSGWINCDEVTTLVGINEAGKSNLLLALWKLNPATGGIIDPLHDLPVSELSVLRDKLSETSFITAEFEVDEIIRKSISSKVECKEYGLECIRITRYYDGNYSVEYPNGKPQSTKTAEETIEEAITDDNGNEEITKKTITKEVEYDENDLVDEIVSALPSFVYYSNYGNLSTKIYLPHVIKWLAGGNIPGIERNEDQVRTLRVLFQFVNLKPEEILALGKDPKLVAREQRNDSEPTKQEIEKAEKDKEERTILLQSAAAKLTKDFHDWWQQGEYKFRFVADGEYFAIWVSDSRRQAEVSLDLRSTGLQWFLSFYLIFLVESQYNHKNAILLLDEAGLTLHPLAQKDLSVFFNQLSKNNQIINTTHSPFIVDANNIDRCKVVYVDKQGYTVASDNLRQGQDELNEKSIYAVHAALGLSVSDILLQGCKPVIVEGPSDQIYLNAIKQVLISKNKISPKEEIVFIPAGGVKGIAGVVSILSGKNGELPYVIVDSDQSGQSVISKLKSGLYNSNTERIIEVGEYTNIPNAEIEDLIPHKYLDRAINHIFNAVEDDDFEPDPKTNIVRQIEDFANRNNIQLEKGWKVDLAKRTKKVILSKNATENETNKWIKLFNTFI